jgi:hypothetical protein
VAVKSVSGDLTKSNEPKKAITISKLSNPSRTKRLSKTNDLEDLSKRISRKGELYSNETLGVSIDSIVGGRKLKAMGAINTMNL